MKSTTVVNKTITTVVSTFLSPLANGSSSAVSYSRSCWYVGCNLTVGNRADLEQLAYEARKAKKIIASRDISYAFTNVMANHYYSLRAYIRIPWIFRHLLRSIRLI